MGTRRGEGQGNGKGKGRGRTVHHEPIINPIRAPRVVGIEREAVRALAAAEDAAGVGMAREDAGCEDGVGEGGGGGGGGVDGGVGGL